MKNKGGRIELIFSIAVIILLALLVLTFFYLYSNVSGGFLYSHRLLFNSFTTAIVAILAAIAIVFQLNDKNFVYRLCMLTLLMASIAMIILYFLKISGFWEKVDSVEDMRAFIAQTGHFAAIAFILMQVLQVIILPIPGIIMIGAGELLFGALKGAIFSFIGIMLGSLIAFFIGRVLGYRAAKWLVGDSIDKVLEKVKGKDKIVLAFMFLFPFFPDDILCFVAGISSMSVLFFVVTVGIARILSVALTALSVSGVLIPINTWWGLTIWGVIGILTIILAVFVYKNGEKIEQRFLSKFDKKDKK